MARPNADDDDNNSDIDNDDDLRLRLPFTLSGVFSFPYVTSLIRMGHPESTYQRKSL